MRRPLPASFVIDPVADVRREAGPYIAMEPNARGNLVAAACRGAAALLMARPDAAVALAHVEPLPDTSAAHLARLRARARRAA